MTVLVLGPAAVADLRAASDYHEAAEAGLSRRFVRSLDEVFTRLEAFPRSAPPVAVTGRQQIGLGSVSSTAVSTCAVGVATPRPSDVLA